MDLSSVGSTNPFSGTPPPKHPVQIASKFHFRGCPARGSSSGGDDDSGDSTPAPPCDEHMVTVKSAQVTQACCPPFDPNCGVPSTCGARCAPVFIDFYESCQAFVEGPELDSFHEKCVAVHHH